MADKQVDYAALSAELDEIVAELQEGEVAIDDAMAKYERGLELVTLLEKHLKTAENKVSKLKAQFGKQA